MINTKKSLVRNTEVTKDIKLRNTEVTTKLVKKNISTIKDILENKEQQLSLLESYEKAMKLLEEAKVEKQLKEIFSKNNFLTTNNTPVNNLDFSAPNKTLVLGGKQIKLVS